MQFECDFRGNPGEPQECRIDGFGPLTNNVSAEFRLIRNKSEKSLMNKSEETKIISFLEPQERLQGWDKRQEDLWRETIKRIISQYLSRFKLSILGGGERLELWIIWDPGNEKMEREKIMPQ